MMSALTVPPSQPAHRARSRSRFWLLVVVFAIGCAADGAAQRRGWGRERFRPAPIQGRTESLYSLPRAQEEIHLWGEAKTKLEAGDVDEAVETLHQLWRTSSGGVVPVGDDRHFGVRQAVLATLRSLSERARAAYEKLARREGGTIFERDLSELDVDDLMRLAEDFPATQRGIAARMRLGHLALERGDGHAAAGHYQRARDAAPPQGPHLTQLERWIAAAAAMTQRRLHRNHDVPGHDAEIAAQVLEACPPSLDPQDWRGFGGGGSGAEFMARPAGQPTLQRRFDEIRPADRNPLTMHATGGADGIYISDGRQVWGLDPLRSDQLWRAPGPLARDVYAGSSESTNPETMHVAAVGEDIIVAALEVPTNEQTLVFRGGITIMSRLPDRRLFAFDRATGQQVWAHYDQIDGRETRRFRQHVASAPPLIQGNTVYCATHDRSGTIALYLTAYELDTGRPRWRRLLCSSQQEVNMFGNAQQEYAAGPLALADGVLYGTSNLGICYAVDAADGAIRWLSAYDVIPLPPTSLHRQDARPVYFANNPPVVRNGVVAMTPLDSEYALALDQATGELVWEMHHSAKAGGAHSVRWLLGAHGDEFVFSGLGVIAARTRPEGREPGSIEPQLRSIRRADDIGHNLRTVPRHLGRGALTDDLIYYSLTSRISAFDYDGNLDYRSADLQINAPGNLLFVDGLAVSVRATDVAVAFDQADLQRRVEALLKKDPDNVVARYRLATLLRIHSGSGGDDGSRAAAAFEAALASAEKAGMGPGVPFWEQISSDLYGLTLERANAIASRDRTRAIELFQRARTRATTPDEWMAAQTRILALLPARERLPELEEMARRHGVQRYAFDDVGSVPIATYALWQKAVILSQQDPTAGLLTYQDLLERYPSESLGSESVREIATLAIDGLIQRHGRGIYETIEARAARALADAESPAEMQGIVDAWPHSAAAETATAQILDLAVTRADLSTVCRVFADRAARSEPEPGLMRRLMIAAAGADNVPLARAVGARLARDHGSMASDMPTDEGRTYAELEAPGLPPAPDAFGLPEEWVGEIGAQPQRLRATQLELAEGFAVPEDLPIYGIVESETLQAFDPTALDDGPLFRRKVDIMFRTVLLAGPRVITPGLSVMAAYHYRTGEPIWEFIAPEDMVLECLGITDGVLHVFAEANNRPSELFGIEPTTGTTLFRRVFAAGALPHPPRATGVDILGVARGTRTGAEAALLRIDPVSGADTAAIPLTDARCEALGLDANTLTNRNFVRGLFADAEHVFVASYDLATDRPPRLAAVRNDGTNAWVWRGRSGCELKLCARRGPTIVLLESNAVQGNHRLITLSATDGEVGVERQLGRQVSVHNWEPEWSHNPLPGTLLLTEADDKRATTLTGLGLGEGHRSFQVDLPADIQNLSRGAITTSDVVVFGARSLRQRPGGGRFSLGTIDRSGGMVAAPQLESIPDASAYSDVHRFGRYTAIGSMETMMVFRQGKR